MNINQQSTEFDEYFTYLKTRSRIGSFYRKFYLYPLLNNYLDGKVIDVGCGLGDFIKYRKNTVGVDVNPRIVEFCQKNSLNVSLIKDQNLHFDNNSFDGVIMDNVLEHITNPKRILNEVNRILNKNGILVIGVPGIKGYQKDPDHKIFYSDEKLSNDISLYGFELIKIVKTPLSMRFLSKLLTSYCIYGIFKKK